MIALLTGCSHSGGDDGSGYIAPESANTQQTTVHATDPPTEAPTQPPTIDNSTIVETTEDYYLTSPESYNCKSCAFTDGVAWATLTKDKSNDKKLALINTRGEIMYIQGAEFENSKLVATPFVHGLSAIYPSYGNGQPNPGFAIINNLGKIVYSVMDNNTYLCGRDVDGNFYIATHNSGFDHNIWTVGVLDSEAKYTDLGIEIPKGVTNSYNNTIRLTNNLIYFQDSCGYLNIKKKCWVNCGPNNMTTLGSTSELAVIEDRGSFFLVPIAALSDITDYKDIKELIKSNSATYAITNGVKGGLLYTQENMSIDSWAFSTWNDGSFYRKYWRTDGLVNKELRYDYLDMNGKLIFEYPTFAEGVKYLRIDDISGGYSAVYLEGVDGKSYVTIIDDKGEPKYPPIHITANSLCSCNGYMLFYDTQEEVYDIITPDGSHKHLGDSLTGLETGRAIYSKNYFILIIGGGYIFCRDGEYKYVSVDGNSYIEKATASYNNNGDLVYFDNEGNKAVNSMNRMQHNSSDETVASIEASTDAQKAYISSNNFSIVGKWKNIGTYTFGQAQKGSIISFNGTNCNFFSPKDTYAFYKDGENYKLDCTSPLADTVSFTVKIIDENNIDVFYGTNLVELTRVE